MALHPHSIGLVGRPGAHVSDPNKPSAKQGETVRKDGRVGRQQSFLTQRRLSSGLSGLARLASGGKARQVEG